MLDGRKRQRAETEVGEGTTPEHVDAGGSARRAPPSIPVGECRIVDGEYFLNVLYWGLHGKYTKGTDISLHSKRTCTRALTFENMCQAQATSRRLLRL
jgi:hypothetical protein